VTTFHPRGRASQTTLPVGHAVGLGAGDPALPGLFNVAREVANQKQTGLGAVAGGFAEYFATFGLLVAFACSATAIGLLLRSFSTGHWVRGVLSFVSILVSTLLIMMFGFFVWIVFFLQRRP